MEQIRAIADAEEKVSCRDMGASQRALDKEIERLNELKAYRQNYEQKRAEPRSASAGQWADYQRFLERLNEAVTAQTQVVLDSRQKLDLHRRHWMSRRQRLDSLGRVVERFRRQESTEEERREQKLLDELSSGNGKPRRDKKRSQ